MIISLNWLKKFTDIDLPVDEFATLIGARLVEIESVESIGPKYKDVIIVRVIECAPVPDSDHLNLTKVDDGGVWTDVERDENGYVQVVCGAPNVRAGILAAWLPPRSTVPESFADAEPFVLGARSLRGHMSNGMLASAKELDLFEDHTGIIEIDKDAAPGTPFAEVYELDDYLLDIENKSLTHRPDTFGVVGFAREVAAIQGKQFTTPDWLTDLQPAFGGEPNVQTPTVTIDDPTLSDRYQAIVLSNVKEAAVSPLQIQTYLSRSGVRPINAVVDVTNYLMLLTGQPLHAFDYDKLLAVNNGTADIRVRSARSDEELTLLDGRTIKMEVGDIVIANGETAVALAGAMGGRDTEIDDATKNIIIESATFNLYNLRTTQMRHGMFSEAVTRFTKGQPAPLTAPVLAQAAAMLAQFTGATIVSAVAEAYPGYAEPVAVEVSIEKLNATLGTKFAVSDIVDVLQNVEFAVEVRDTTIVATPPYWRHDIHIPEDIIEEMGRLNGYDSIELELPKRDFTAVAPSSFEQLRQTVRRLLVRAGANEVLTYSFIHGDTMRKAGQNPDDAYRITNSISPDLQYYRQSITPSLLSNIHANIKSGYDSFALFEFNKFHTKKHPLTDEGVPLELDGLAFVTARAGKSATAAFYDAKRYLDYVATSLGLEFVYEPLEADGDYPVTQPFEPLRSARVWEKYTRERIGVVGEYKRSTSKAFKLPEHIAGFEIAPRGLLKLVQAKQPSYVASSKFPGVERDICFQVDEGVAYQSIVDSAITSLQDQSLQTTVEPVDIYQAENTQTKNVTIRISLNSAQKTLSGDDVKSVIDSLSAKVITDFNATII